MARLITGTITSRDLDMYWEINRVATDRSGRSWDMKNILAMTLRARLASAAFWPVPHSLCVGKGFVSRPHLLGELHRWSCYLTSVKLKGTRNCLRMMKNEKRKMKMMKKVNYVRGNDHFMHGWDETNTRTSWATRCVQRMSVAIKTEQRLRRLTTTSTFTCSCCPSYWCFSGSRFSSCHWCWTHRSARSFHSSTALHHPNAIPSAKLFCSGCCSPTLSCHHPLNQFPKFLHISHRENGSFEVLSLHTRRLQ